MTRETQACQERYRWHRIVEAGPWVIWPFGFIHSLQIRISVVGFEIGRNHSIRRRAWPWSRT